MIRLVGGEDNRRAGNAMIVAGAGLTGGSYLLGRVLSASNRTGTRSRNEELTDANQRAQTFNNDIDRRVRDHNAERRARWRAANRKRGLVEVTVK